MGSTALCWDIGWRGTFAYYLHYRLYSLFHKEIAKEKYMVLQPPQTSHLSSQRELMLSSFSREELALPALGDLPHYLVRKNNVLE